MLEGDLQRARQGRDIASASKQEARENLRQARDALDEEQARFRSYMGPVVNDGAHVGRLIAVGADQSPARVTIDLGRMVHRARRDTRGDRGRRDRGGRHQVPLLPQRRPDLADAPRRHVRHGHRTTREAAVYLHDRAQRAAAPDRAPTPGAPSASRTIRSASRSPTAASRPSPSFAIPDVCEGSAPRTGRPRRTRRVADTSAWWACAISWTIERPRPVPPESRSRASCSRSKRSKIRLRSIGGDAGAVVVDRQDHLVVGPSQPQGHRGVGVTDRVVDEVANEAFEVRGVAADAARRDGL